LLSSQILAVLSNSAPASSPALWRVFYPKLFMVQTYADALISKSDFVGFGPVHPLINILAFILVFLSLTLITFNKRSI